MYQKHESNVGFFYHGITLYNADYKVRAQNEQSQTKNIAKRRSSLSVNRAHVSHIVTYCMYQNQVCVWVCVFLLKTKRTRVVAGSRPWAKRVQTYRNIHTFLYHLVVTRIAQTSIFHQRLLLLRHRNSSHKSHESTYTLANGARCECTSSILMHPPPQRMRDRETNSHDARVNSALSATMEAPI